MRVNMIELIGNQELMSNIANIELVLPLGLSWIFTGPRGVGKALFAKQWAVQKLTQASSGAQLANHPDLHLIKPVGFQALHTMERMRSLRETAQLPPTLSPFKIFIIESAERLPLVCSNYLLKLLEEPPRDTLFILTTHDLKALPKTVCSRCRLFHFAPLSPSELKDYSGIESPLLELAKGSLARSKRLCSEQAQSERHHLFSALSRIEELSLSEIIELADHVSGRIGALVSERRSKLEERLTEEKERLGAYQYDICKAEIEGELSLLEKEVIDEHLDEIILFFRDSSAKKEGAESLFDFSSPDISPIDVENGKLKTRARELSPGEAITIHHSDGTTRGRIN